MTLYFCYAVKGRPVTPLTKTRCWSVPAAKRRGTRLTPTSSQADKEIRTGVLSTEKVLGLVTSGNFLL